MNKRGDVSYWNFLNLVAILLFVTAYFLFFAIKPIFSKIPSDFQYNPLLFSVDNFYDPIRGDFGGGQISLVGLDYQVISTEGDILTIKNTFDVMDPIGIKIISIERNYGINKNTGMHVKGFGDKDREGYLFAPIGLKKGQNFTYWHINYDSPAFMKYIEEESLFGLNVYHYRANYHSDQTQNLDQLPGVPEERGINLDINLDLWVEPITGRMIKYKDVTTAFYYDIKTKERIHPWNKFYNEVKDVSVKEQVYSVKSLKRKILFLGVWLPLILCIVGALILLNFYFYKKGFLEEKPAVHSNRKHTRNYFLRYSFWMMVLALSLFAIYFFLSSQYYFEYFPADPDGKTTIVISKWISHPDIENNIIGFKESLENSGYFEGKNVDYIVVNAEGDIERQFELIRSAQEMNVDMIYSAATVGTLIAGSVTSEIPIVFSMVSYPAESKIIKSMESSGNNLVGTRNYIPPSKQFSIFEQIYPDTKVLAFVRSRIEPNSAIQYHEFESLLKKRNIKVMDLTTANLDELKMQLEKNKDQFDAIYASCDTLIQSAGQDLMIEFSKENKKPMFTCVKEGVLKGALIGNVANSYAIGRISGEKASLILKGAKPQWLETESPRENYIIINKRTAQHLGLKIPQDLMNKAEIVE